jgi:transposase
LRAARVWRVLLGVQHTVVEGVEFETAPDGEVLIARVRPTRSRAGRCGRCGRRSPGYDQGEGERRWRGLDLGATRVYLAAPAPRVTCAEHGVTVIAVPWARHGSRFTIAFEDTAAWLACHAALSVLAELLRVTWRSVAGIIVRVVAEAAGRTDRLSGLRRVGIDEISYRKGQRYLLCAVDHDSGRLVWAAKGRNQTTLRGFFDLLGEQRATQLTHVSADGAEWIHDVVTERAPQAVICLDAFHVVAWATTALDAVRRGMWNQLRTAGMTDEAKALKGTRWALLRNPRNQSGNQRTTVATIAKVNKPLYRAYLLKEQLRMAFEVKGQRGRALLTGWLAWAQRSRLPEFVELAKTIKRFLPLIHNTLDHELSNALAEATNTHLRLLTRRAYGYHSPDALIAMATLTRGGLCPPLPGRS